MAALNAIAMSVIFSYERMDLLSYSEDNTPSTSSYYPENTGPMGLSLSQFLNEC